MRVTLHYIYRYFTPLEARLPRFRDFSVANIADGTLFFQIFFAD